MGRFFSLFAILLVSLLLLYAGRPTGHCAMGKTDSIEGRTGLQDGDELATEM